MRFNIISVVGLGYIGLPTAAIIASRKRSVIGVDINQAVVNTINSGNIHIVEPGLQVLVKDAVLGGFLRASIVVESADVYLIAVPTPFLPGFSSSDTPQPNLSYIKAACKAIAKVLKKGDLVILESTSPVGTTEEMAAWLLEDRQDLTFPQTHGENSDIRVAYCPERVLPGQVIRELVENDRIIGGMTQKCSEAAIELYRIFSEGECIETTPRTAEMAKLTENASRDVSIAFANELSIICDGNGVNVDELISLANRHPRVNILNPGPGVGGHCIAVDPWFIVAASKQESKMIRLARETNDSKRDWVVNKIISTVESFSKTNPNLRKKDIVIACYGLTFKPDIDDVRESPALYIVSKLAESLNCKILAVDPNLKELPLILRDKVVMASLEKAGEIADINVFLVAHKEFRGVASRASSDLDFVNAR